MPQQMQPPPLAPLQLLGSDYLTATASTTLHQHTQTHSTRLVALTETKRKPNNTSGNIPLPIPSHTLIKIEDCSGSTSCGGNTATHHQQSTIFEQEKSTIQTSTIATSVQTNDVPAHLYYQHPNLIQIAPHNPQTEHTIEPSPPQQHHVSIQQLSPPSDSSACLTPPPEHNMIQDLSMHHHHEVCQNAPEVQDANIQTDLMSEDDNTNECSFPASEHSNGDDTHKFPSVTSSMQHHDNMCHRMNDDDEDDEDDEDDNCMHDESSKNIMHEADDNAVSTMVTEPPSPVNMVLPTPTVELSPLTTTNVQIFQNEKVETKLFGKCDIIKISVPPSTTTSTTMTLTSTDASLEAIISTPTAKSCSIMQVQQLVCSQQQAFEENKNLTPPKPNVAHLNPPMVDVSGLELLSNSIEAFEKKVVFKIKQEPLDEMTEEQTCSAQMVNDVAPKTNQRDGELEGLNLLCALAEQRFKEEIDQSKSSDLSPTTESSPEEKHKKRKHKHSKSSKKSKHDRKDRKRKHRSDEDEEDEEEDIAGNGGGLKETLNRVKAKYPKCQCSKTERDEKCCREKCNWPSHAEIFSAMENDMKQRLAAISRQCEEKQRQLDEIRPILKTLKSFPSDSTITKTSSQIFPASAPTTPTFPITKIAVPIVSPNFSNSSQSESTLIELPKISSDTDVESNSSEKQSKRKLNVPKKQDDNNVTETIFAKKPKNLVGYIFASKNRMSSDTNIKNENSSAMLSYTCEIDDKHASKKHKSESRPFLKIEDDESNSLPPTLNKPLSPFQVHTPIKLEAEGEDVATSPQTINAFSMFTSEKKLSHKSKHSKHKKSRDKERKHHRRSSEGKERKRRIDSLCTLTEEHLEKNENTRVITAMGGLFYAGRLSAIEPPDVYAVTLDGERGNRPHIMSQEEILRDAVSWNTILNMKKLI